MTSRPDLPVPIEALPNPRGGSVRLAEMALTDAQHAFARQGETAPALKRAIAALHSAGWLPAQRFAEALALVTPLGDDSEATHDRIALAMSAFCAAVERHNLRELSCSTELFDHYRGLHALLAAHTRIAPVSYDDLALAGRAIAPSTLRGVAPERLARVRAHYEASLLALLRAPADQPQAAIDETFSRLDACLAELAGPDPYDFWRLASSTVRALRERAGRHADVSAYADAKRLYARFNLVLADQAHASTFAPRSLVRATLALLWRDFALYGATPEDAEHVDVLRDYGLTVAWHVAATPASEAAWEQSAAQASEESTREAVTRDLGVLRVNAAAYEDFLQSAEASIEGLVERGTQASETGTVDAAAALHAANASHRLGAAACALGLGHVALLADTLGLAWRRVAHQGEGADQRDARGLDASIPERAAQMLRSMLHQAAAGIAPSEGRASIAALTAMIERPSAVTR
ncbi:hypothetical protein P9239_07745 [Caballeronia sp. LZ062]|uniref:hypothetical protein n=1 Tax=unclassified Caballeronia TaxID=2646786 RepID=UPI0028617D4E|nr:MULTISPECIES: hypothetical protein [unclassified Caballeronia]MDR5855224.1 hypothetical protein [Caballeronia sp. LZ050]MDR5870247.1 hypothetical protein [Caballeronia sp. LZ062]